jgi:hypothetical protein
MTIIWALLLLGMYHDTTGIPVYVIRESEIGQYDTVSDTVSTLFDFDTKWVLDGKNYPKPKYNIEIRSKQVWP